MTKAANAATIFTKDDLRAEVETESGGKQTVLYTAKGQPTFMNIVPAFRLEELGPGFGTGLHPAFLVGGVEKSEIMIGTYQAVIRGGEALSLPGEDPATGIDFDQARAACLAAGTGFHLVTNWEWAALALWCEKNGFGALRGNTNFGKSHAAEGETGTVTKYGRTRTGSGPDAWRHDGTPYGIADLVGNIWEWTDGLKLQSGQIIMPSDNSYLLPEKEWPSAGACFDYADGDFRISDAISDTDYDSLMFRDLQARDDFEVLETLRRALLYPFPGQNLTGRVWIDNTEEFEALPIRGGGWYFGDDAGLGALALISERSLRYCYVGFRPAFIG